MNIRLTAFRIESALNNDIPHMGFLELLEYKAYLENIGLRQKLAEIASSSLYLKRESAKRPFRLFLF